MADASLKFIVNDKGKKTAAVLPIKEYLQLIEDLHDLAVVAERREEPDLSHEGLKARVSDE